eukprot:Trichotokara_eunicae@DN4315_c0_g1_i3.p1
MVLPTILVRLLIPLVSVCVPVFCSLICLFKGNTYGMKYWLCYFLYLSLFNVFIVPFEPILVSVFKWIPFTMYYDLKLTHFTALVIPRTGVLNKIISTVENIRTSKFTFNNFNLENLQEMFEKIRKNYLNFGSVEKIIKNVGKLLRILGIPADENKNEEMNEVNRNEVIKEMKINETNFDGENIRSAKCN